MSVRARFIPETTLDDGRGSTLAYGVLSRGWAVWPIKDSYFGKCTL